MPPSRPIEPDRMHFVEIGHRGILFSDVAQLADRGDVAVHRIDRLEADELGPIYRHTVEQTRGLRGRSRPRKAPARGAQRSLVVVGCNARTVAGALPPPDLSRRQLQQWLMEVGEIRRVQRLNVRIMLAIEWRHVSVARCGTLRNLPPRSRASPQGRDADRRACGRVYFGHHFDLDKVRQALNADSPPLLTVMGRGTKDPRHRGRLPC